MFHKKDKNHIILISHTNREFYLTGMSQIPIIMVLIPNMQFRSIFF